MKTIQNALKAGGLLSLIMAAFMALAFMGCEKESPIYPERPLESEAVYTGNILTQSFMVYPEGTEVSLFGGTIWMKFLEGTVSGPTEFRITGFPVHHLDLGGLNVYNRGISLESEIPNQYLANVIVRINYDLAQDSWIKSAPSPEAEKNLTIYHVSPNIYAYQRINSIGNCCVDYSCKMIKGCISCCGFYVVGEN